MCSGFNSLNLFFMRLAYAPVAQLVERRIEAPSVGGSNPSWGTISWIGNCYKNPIIWTGKPNLPKDPHQRIHTTLHFGFLPLLFVFILLCLLIMYKAGMAVGNVLFLYIPKYIETKTINAGESFYI